MEYLGNCPKCKHHTIVKTVKQIAHDSHNPQREAKCVNCGKLSRITLIGEVEDYTYQTSVNPEFATHNNLTLRFW